MIVVAIVLLFLGIVKKFEPLLLVPIAVGMLVTNLPGAEMYHEILFAGGHIHWDLFGGNPITAEFIAEMQASGVSEAVLSGRHRGTDGLRGPDRRAVSGHQAGHLSLPDLHGRGRDDRLRPPDRQPQEPAAGRCRAAGHLPDLSWAAACLGCSPARRPASIGIIGGADGPTAIFVTAMLAPALLGPIAVSAYSYMALVPVIQPPIMKALTTEKERQIVMKPLREVSQEGEDHLPHRGHHLCGAAGALRRASDRLPDAGQSVPRSAASPTV